MGTRSFAQVAPTSATIALNAYIFGYGGHSLVTPHVALKQTWWTEERIRAKVTQSFISSKLRGEEREFLERSPAFAEGLTDDTYLDWILVRAKRLFLILAEVGVPDQIFGCVDDLWDDDDLPIDLESVPDLDLAEENDPVLDKKFYDTQFIYLLRELEQGTHIDYGPKEHIPMDHVNTIPPAVNLQVFDRVNFPGRPDVVYMRRKYLLKDKDTNTDHRETFMSDVQKAQKLRHEHVASVWASYTTENSSYVLSDFVGEHTLGTFIDHRMPSQYERVAPSERPAMLCEWMHCLSDALAFLHNHGMAHTAIRPSNILIDRENRIAFADIGSIRTFQRGKKVNKTEIYDYAAPESPSSRASTSSTSSPPISSMAAFNKLRKKRPSTSSSSASSSASSRSNSISTAATSPTTPPPSGRGNTSSTMTTAVSPVQRSPSIRNFSRHLSDQAVVDDVNAPLSRTGTASSYSKSTIRDPSNLIGLPESSAKMSDVFSLACVFLDIVTFIIKGKITDFVKFRTTRINSIQSKRTRSRNDSSFHSNLERIDDWMEMLENTGAKHSEQLFQGIPELLQLLRKMFERNATLRPTALEVRNQLESILTDHCGIEALCCAGRAWETPPLAGASRWSSTDYIRDSVSIATGIVSHGPSRAASECPQQASRCDEQVDVLSRAQSNTTGTEERKSASAGSGVARFSSWRRAFSRSS